MRVCVIVATGKILETQSGDAPDFAALLANAAQAGFAANQVFCSVQNDAAVIEALRLQDARRRRSLFAIHADLTALSNPNKTLVWDDLKAGSPPKIAATVGPNHGNIFLLWRLAENAALPAATVLDMKVTAAAYYVQDNPLYLVNFAPGIDVRGDEPVT